MNSFFSIWKLLVACLARFHRTTIAPETGGDSLPPIRYEGDPRDIYLA
jgi:hypothetical protein